MIELFTVKEETRSFLSSTNSIVAEFSLTPARLRVRRRGADTRRAIAFSWTFQRNETVALKAAKTASEIGLLKFGHRLTQGSF
jgi:hypothetical protein